MLFSKEDLDDILKHYPPYVHELIIKQLGIVSAIILNNQGQYTTDEGFRNALDMILANVIEGKFLPMGVKLIE